jgi:excisionase family DNA binding protein
VQRKLPDQHHSEFEALLSPEEVARVCGLSRRAVYRAIARGELRAARLCNRLRVQPGELERWIGERTFAVDPPAKPERSRRSHPVPGGGLRALLDQASDG